MNENPAYDRQRDGSGEAAGKKPSGAGHIQTCRDKSNDIDGSEQNGANKCGNLFRGHFFHLKTSFLHTLSVHIDSVFGYLARCIILISHTLSRFRPTDNAISYFLQNFPMFKTLANINN